MTEDKSKCPFCDYEDSNSGNVSGHINQNHRGFRYQQKEGVFSKVTKGNTNKSDSRNSKHESFSNSE
jgi:hypothetical protein